jgi:hypothetical protein
MQQDGALRAGEQGQLGGAIICRMFNQQRRLLADGTRLFFSPAAEILAWRRVDAEDVGEQLHTPVRAPESRSGDGKMLSFVVSVDNRFSAWTMNLETRERTQIPDSGPEALGTNISPDGRWIAYQSTATGRYEI